VSGRTTSAKAESLKGYLNTKPLSARYFIAVTDGEVVNTVPIKGFPRHEQDTMFDCMYRKETHAIMIDATDGPYKNVRCVRAPGFFKEWSAAADKIAL
jgi:hypothetical protein